MNSTKIKRKLWSVDDKLFFIRLLSMPGTNGKSQSVSDVSNFYGVSAKSLYEWLEIFKSSGIDGFNSKPRKVSNSKSRDEELRKEIFETAIFNPDKSATELIKKLSKKYQRISEPTVQKILKDKNLHTLSNRYAATEYEYVKNHIPITREIIETLIKNNPYLDLLTINSRTEGVIFFLKTISLVPYFGKNTGYLLLGVDTKSLSSFSLVWDGVNQKELKDFVTNLKDLFGKKHKNDVYFECEDKWPFSQLKSEKNNPDIQWINSAEYYFSVDRYLVALKETINGFRRDFLRAYKFSNLENLRNDLDAFLIKQRISSGPLGFPTFGQSRFHIHKSNLNNL